MINEKEIKTEETLPAEAQLTPPAAGNPAPPAPKKAAPKKKRHIIRNIIVGVILVALLGLAVWGCMKFFGGGEEEGEVMHAYVDIGSIISTVSGEGLTRAKDSANLTLTASGVVQDVFVSQGEHVEAGQQLYVIRSDAAQDAVSAARREVESCAEELQKLHDAQANLTVRAPHGGKLLEVQDLSVGDTVSKGETIATLVDDSKMKLTQYYSYAYAEEIKVGQPASISVPSTMTQIDGKVSEIYLVERISAEGTKLFEVVFEMKNPGTLTAGVSASATVDLGGELAYPYEAGALEYYQSSEIVTKAGGPAEQIHLRNYTAVNAGDVLLVMGGSDNDSAIFNMNKQLKDAQKTLEEAQKALDTLNGVSPIAGTVMSVSIEPGQEVTTGTTVVVVSDTNTIVMDARVDERNVSYVKEGMMVDIDQWGTMTMGTITSVSLTSDTSNGVATFPATISIDNAEGLIMPGSYATYSLVASQSNDCIIVPIQAVKSVETAEGTQNVVFVHTDERPENAIDLEIPVDGVPESGYWPVPVTTGINDMQNVEILSGLEVGMEVFQQVMYSNMW